MPDQYIKLENRVAGDARVLALVELNTAPPISAYGVSPHRKIVPGIFNPRSTLLTRVIGPVLYPRYSAQHLALRPLHYTIMLALLASDTLLPVSSRILSGVKNSTVLHI